MLVIKYGKLCPVTESEFIKYAAQIISYRSLTQIKVCRNFFVTVSICNFFNDFKFTLIYIVVRVIKFMFFI